MVFIRQLSLTVVIAFSLSGCTFSSSVGPVSEAGTSSSSPNTNYSDCVVGAISIGPCTLKQSGVAVVSDFGSDILNWSLQGTTVKATIPNGFYANHSVEFTEPNLLAGNIKSGVSIFGVNGTASINCDSSLNFLGITTISSVTATSLTINWVNIASANGYVIVDVSSPATSKIVSMASAGQSFRAVTGLIANTQYTFKVRAMNSSGNFDCNTATTTVTTSSQVIPSDLSGLSIWLRNESLSSNANLAAVTQWDDSSSNSRHFQQGTVNLKPIYQTNQLNGLGGLFFDGVDDYMSIATNYASNNFTVFIVAKAMVTDELDSESNSGTSGVAGQHFLLYPEQSSGDGGMGISMGTNGVSVFEHGGSYIPALAVYASSIATPQIVTVSYLNKQPSIFTNGVFRRTGYASPRPNSFAPHIMGGLTGGYGWFQGYVFEMIIFNRTLNSTEQTDIENYLKNKFAL